MPPRDYQRFVSDFESNKFYSDSEINRPFILFLAPETCRTYARTGIQRVVVQVARALLSLAEVQFVKWDAVDGQLRYFDSSDFDNFFQSKSWPENIEINKFSARRKYRFDETISLNRKKNTWLFMPEISYHMASGAEIYSRVLMQAREYGIRTAAVFYDLIPITNPDYYQGGTRPHERYVRELTDVDLVIPISVYASDDLRRYQAESLGLDDERRGRIGQTIAPVLLAMVNSGAEARQRAALAVTAPRDIVFLLGTVEPRKRQVEVIRAFKRGRLAEKYGLKVVVVGSLHPKVAIAFHELVDDDPNILYFGYADDTLVENLFDRARFCVFASNDEGFGLPICESLAHGVPCLAADFGSMREVGEGGGCLLVDVNDEAELVRGLERLAAEDNLIESLRSEIVKRDFRTWDDYARDVLDLMRAHEVDRGAVGFADEIRRAVRAFLKGPSIGPQFHQLMFDGEMWALICLNGLDSPDRDRRSEVVKADRTAVLIAGNGSAADRADSDALDRLFEADAWIFEERSAFDRLVARAEATGYTGMLPSCCTFAEGADLADSAVAALVEQAGGYARRRRIAAREEAVTTAHRAGVEFRTTRRLDIIISTYNRGPFVAENVRWLLSMLGRYEGRVGLTVVDNASTDDTHERLAPFAADPNLKIVRNAANVGMLGNLQVCSTLLGAQHSWVVGDDDFIVPGAIDAVLASIENDPYLPFVFVNFGVYHRTALGPEDRADLLIRDPILLAPHPSPTGLYPVHKIGAEHDNLFTAIYPIVFRTDILSACFNYPFTGRPFSSLIESIPTTKIILETYGQTTAQWIAEVGIVGNAHNSWARYRVPWHGVLMPQAFELAREAGVEGRTLFRWSQLHRQLFDEAENLFPGERLDSYFKRQALDTSLRVFRANIEAQKII